MEREELLGFVLATEKGRELLYTLAFGTIDITFALSTESTKYFRAGFEDRAEELLDLSLKISGLAQEIGLAQRLP